jgi:hypothetical protein
MPLLLLIERATYREDSVFGDVLFGEASLLGIASGDVNIKRAALCTATVCTLALFDKAYGEKSRCTLEVHACCLVCRRKRRTRNGRARCRVFEFLVIGFAVDLETSLDSGVKESACVSRIERELCLILRVEVCGRVGIWGGVVMFTFFSKRDLLKPSDSFQLPPMSYSNNLQAYFCSENLLSAK